MHNASRRDLNTLRRTVNTVTSAVVGLFSILDLRSRLTAGCGSFCCYNTNTLDSSDTDSVHYVRSCDSVTINSFLPPKSTNTISLSPCWLIFVEFCCTLSPFNFLLLISHTKFALGWLHTCNVTAYRNTASWQCGRDLRQPNISKVGYAVTLRACSLCCRYLAVASKGYGMIRLRSEQVWTCNETLHVHTCSGRNHITLYPFEATAKYRQHTEQTCNVTA